MNNTAYYPMFDVDFPDPDIIRVGATYYMLCTTMYFFPGCEILSSTDLLHWKHETYVFDRLDGTDAQKLISDNIYGKGMWAATLRYHEGTFYICFVANDTHTTYLFRAKEITGPWTMSKIEGFYHDSSLLFDDDGRIYIAYGNREIYITELNSEMTGPKEGGLHRLVITDSPKCSLGYEGTHLYKINGMYYLFFIHSLEGRWYRSEACFYCDSLTGDFVGGEVFTDDNGYRNMGIAQGGIVDTPAGDWYAVLFQDRGGSGRIPYLIPMHFEGVRPVIGDEGKLPTVPEKTAISADVLDFTLSNSSDNTHPGVASGDFSGNTHPGVASGNSSDNTHHRVASGLIGSDDFKTVYSGDSCFGFSPIWQFNHEPDMSLIKRNTDEGSYTVTTDRVCSNPTQARNSLTQRMSEVISSAQVCVDASSIKDGDYVGITALQYLYGFIGIRRNGDSYEIIYTERNDDNAENTIVVEKTTATSAKFRITSDFGGDDDYAVFAYDIGAGFKTININKSLRFRLEHFTGYRFALTCFSTKQAGGSAKFSEFKYC